MAIDGAGLIAALVQNGGLGIVIAYLIYREKCDRTEREKHAEKRQTIEERDIESREKLAASLMALTMVIQGRPHV